MRTILQVLYRQFPLYIYLTTSLGIQIRSLHSFCPEEFEHIPSTPPYVKFLFLHRRQILGKPNRHLTLKIERKQMFALHVPLFTQQADSVKVKRAGPTVPRPMAGYGLPPPRGNFVDHIFLEAQCLARILQHVSPLTMGALSCNSLLYTLLYKIFDN